MPFKQIFKKYNNPKLFLPLSLVLFSFLVYWFTKPPSILYIDSGTMIAASYSLGIPNPPGFPFYMMASHLFSILPIFNVLTRLELFTIVFSVAALLLTYKIILILIEENFSFFKGSNPSILPSKLNKNVKYYAAFFGSITLAFSYEYWSQSQNTEAFIFTDFFLVLFIYIILLLEKKKKQANFANLFFKGLLLLGFLFGLAVGANPTIGVLVPGVLLVMFLNRKALSLPKILIPGVIFIITTIIIYLYLPIRAQSWPFVNWGNPQTLNLFLGQIRGAGLNIYDPSTNSINGFTGSPVVFLQSVSHFFFLILIQFTPFLLPFIFLGSKFIYKKNKILFWFFTSVILVDVIYSGLYFSGNQEAWFIPSWIILAIFIGFGFYFTLLNLRSSKTIKLLLIISILPLIFWFIPLNRSGHYYSSDYANNLYSNLGKNAILLETGDFTNSLGNYVYAADKFRSDVIPLTVNVFYVNKWYRDGLRHSTNLNISNDLEKIIQYKSYSEFNREMNQFIADNIDKRPIYVTQLTTRGSTYAGAGSSQGLLTLDSRFKFIPNGLTFRVVKRDEDAKPNMKAFNYEFKSNDFPQKTPFYFERNYNTAYTNIKNDYAYGYEALGDWFLDKKNLQEAFKYYVLADKWSQNNLEILSRFGQYYGIKKQYDISIQYFNKALELDSNSLALRFNLAQTLGLMGRLEEARQQYQIIEQLAPYDEIASEAKNRENLLNLQDNTGKEIYYENNEDNLSFSYPNNWKIRQEQDGRITLSNSKSGNDALNLVFLGRQNSKNQNLHDLLAETLLKQKGTLFDTKSFNMPGFNAYTEVYLDNQELSQLIYIQKGNWVWFVSLKPGSSTRAGDFYNLLNTFKPLY